MAAFLLAMTIILLAVVVLLAVIICGSMRISFAMTGISGFNMRFILLAALKHHDSSSATAEDQNSRHDNEEDHRLAGHFLLGRCAVLFISGYDIVVSHRLYVHMSGQILPGKINLLR